jgi:hypothetical protein
MNADPRRRKVRLFMAVIKRDGRVRLKGGQIAALDETLAVELLKAGVDDYVAKHGRRRLSEAVRAVTADLIPTALGFDP